MSLFSWLSALQRRSVLPRSVYPRRCKPRPRFVSQFILLEDRCLLSYVPVLTSTSSSLSQVVAMPADLPARYVTVMNNSNNMVYPILTDANTTLDNTAGKVVRVTVTNGGAYAIGVTPTVQITGGGGSGATAFAVMAPLNATQNTIREIQLHDDSGMGTGYTSAPTVTISGNGGAQATAVISTAPTAKLQSGINATQTTIQVNAVPANIPKYGQFTIIIGGEAMLVDATTTNSTTWTVRRGTHNPLTGATNPGAAHNAGDTLNIPMGLYNAIDPFDQGYRGYIGELVNGQVQLGLRPHSQVTIQVPLAFWDGGRVFFVDGGKDGVQSADDPFNPLNPNSNVWNFNALAPSFIVSASFPDQASSYSNDAGRVMWYHDLIPKDFDTSAPGQLAEWTIRDPLQYRFAPNIPLSQLKTIFNYDVSYVDNLTLPVVMEATNAQTLLPEGYTGPTVPAAPLGALGADVSVEQMQQAFRAFTETPTGAGQLNSLLQNYFGGKGYDQFYFPPGLNTLQKLPAGYNLFALAPTNLTPSPFDTTKFQLVSGGAVAKVSISGTLAPNSNQITGVDAAKVAQLAAGMLLTGGVVEQGGDFKKGTYILSVSGTTVTLSSNAIYTGAAKTVNYDFAGSQFSSTGSLSGGNSITLVDPKVGVFLRPGMLVTGPGIGATSYNLIQSISADHTTVTLQHVSGPVPTTGSGTYFFTTAPSSYIESTLINNWYSWADYYVNNVNAPASVSGTGTTYGKNNPNDQTTLMLDGLSDAVYNQLKVGMVVSGPNITASATDPTKNTTIVAIGVDENGKPKQGSIRLSNPVLTSAPANSTYTFTKPLPVARSADAQPYTLTFPTTGQPNDPALAFAASVYDVMQAWSKLSEPTYQTRSALLMQYVIGGNIGTFALQQGQTLPTIRLNQIRDNLKSVLRGVANYQTTPEFDSTGKQVWYPNPGTPTPGAKINGVDANFGVYNLNPYVWFVHVVLGMSGYGFSLDDDTADINSNGTNLQMAFGTTQATSPKPAYGPDVQSLAKKELYTPGAPFGTLNDTGYIDTISGAARGYDLRQVTMISGLSVATVGKLKAADTETLGALVTGLGIDTSNNKRPRVSLVTVVSPNGATNQSWVLIDQPTPSNLLAADYKKGDWQGNTNGASGQYRFSGFVQDMPVVTNFTPPSGAVGSGPITITGNNFMRNAGVSDVLGVFFNGQPVPRADYTVDSNTQITVTKVPLGATTGRIAVRGHPGTGYSATSQANVDFIVSGGGTFDGAQSTVTVQSATMASGATQTVTLTARDSTGTLITNLNTANITFSLSTGAGLSTGTFGSTITNVGNGTYTVQFTGGTPGTAATVGASVSGTAVTSALPTVTVTGAAFDASQSTVSVASPTMATGTSQTVTLTARDSTGTVINNLNLATIVFSLSTGAGVSTGTFGATITNAGNGQYTVQLTGNTAGTAATVSASVGGTPVTSVLPTVTVTAPTFDPSTSTVTVDSPTMAVGTSQTVTLTARDSTGTEITNLNPATIVFSLSTGAGVSTGTFGAVTNNNDGTYTAQLTAGTAGTAATVNASVSGTAVTSTLPTVTVTAATFDGSKSTVSVSSPTMMAGTSQTVTLTARDTTGTVITNLNTATIVFSLSTGAGVSTGTFGSTITNAGNGQYTVQLTGNTAGTPATVNASVGGSAVTTVLPQVTVTAAPAFDGSKSTVSVASPTMVSGASQTVTLTARDTTGAVITNLNTATIVFSLSTGAGVSTGTFGSTITNNNDGTYTVQLTGNTAGTPATVNASVGGTAVTTTLPTVTVTAAPTFDGSKSTVSVASATMISGTTQTVTLTAKDTSGAAIPNLNLASIVFSLSTGAGVSTGTFGAIITNVGNGTYTVQLTGNTVGTAATVNASVVGTAVTTTLPTVTVTPAPVFDGSKSTVEVESATMGSGTTQTVTLTAKDTDGNVMTNLNTATIVFSLSTGAGVSTGTFGSAITNEGDGTYTVHLTGGTAGTAATVNASVGGTAVATTLPTVTVTSTKTLSIALETFTNPAEFGQGAESYTVLVTVPTASDPAPTGAITMTIDGVTVPTTNGPYVQDGTNLNQYRVTLSYGGTALTVGTHQIAFTVAADHNYNQASTTPQSQVVEPAFVAMGFPTVSPGTSTVGDSVIYFAELTTAVVDQTPDLTGTVTFTARKGAGPTITLGSVAVVGGGNSYTASLTTAAPLPAGTYDITATFVPGDGNYAGASAFTFAAQVVSKATPGFAFDATTPITPAQPLHGRFPVTYNLVLTAPVNAPAPTGQVTLTGTSHATGDTVTLGTTQTFTALGGGSYRVTVVSNGPVLSPGNYTITAWYAGDSNFNLVSVTTQQTVLAAPILGVSFTSAPTTLTPGTSAVFDIKVSNTGSAAESSGVLQQTLPAGTTFNAGLSSAGWNEASPGVFRIALPNIPVGGSVNVQFGVSVPTNTAGGSTVTTATVFDSLSPDPLASVTANVFVVRGRLRWPSL